MPRPLRLAKSAHKRPSGERGRGEKTHQESFINSTGKFLRFSWRQTACVCVGLVCVSVCEVCLCVCVCWSMRHQFACIRNSFPLVIESLDKLSTAIGTYCLPLPPLPLSHPTAPAVMQINEHVGRRATPHPLSLFWPALSLLASVGRIDLHALWQQVHYPNSNLS